jgi:hypothetical protein
MDSMVSKASASDMLNSLTLLQLKKFHPAVIPFSDRIRRMKTPLPI